MLARYVSMAVFLTLIVAASMLGSSFEAGEWYYTIMKKPSWMPPEWLFGLGWAVTYLLMALAAWQVWLTGHYERLGALIWWVFLLAMNVCWFALFFGLNRIGWAWLLLGLTMGVAVLCIRAFRLLSKQAAYLMMPCLVWIFLTWALNLWLWTINGGILYRIFIS